MAFWHTSRIGNALAQDSRQIQKGFIPRGIRHEPFGPDGALTHWKTQAHRFQRSQSHVHASRQPQNDIIVMRRDILPETARWNLQLDLSWQSRAKRGGWYLESREFIQGPPTL